MFGKNLPEPAPPRSIWTNLFGEAIGGVALAILGGVSWLVISLPTQLNSIESHQDQVIKSLDKIVKVQEKHEEWLQDHERRLIREEEAIKRRYPNESK